MVTAASLTRSSSLAALDGLKASTSKKSTATSPDNSSTSVVSLGAVSTITNASTSTSTTAPQFGAVSEKTDDMRKPSEGSGLSVRDLINGAQYGEDELNQDMQKLFENHGRGPTFDELTQVTAVKVLGSPVTSQKTTTDSKIPTQKLAAAEVLRRKQRNTFDAQMRNFVIANNRAPKLAELNISIQKPAINPASTSATKSTSV